MFSLREYFVSCTVFKKYRMIKKSLYTWWLRYNRQVHRDFLIILYFFRCTRKSHGYSAGCPTPYRTRHFLNNFTTNEDIATKFEADLPHWVRNVKEKNVLLFKFRYNIFIGVRIIKEMPGSVASGTPCIFLDVLCSTVKPRKTSALKKPVRKILPLGIKFILKFCLYAWEQRGTWPLLYLKSVY